MFQCEFGWYAVIVYKRGLTAAVDSRRERNSACVDGWNRSSSMVPNSPVDHAPPRSLMSFLEGLLLTARLRYALAVLVDDLHRDHVLCLPVDGMAGIDEARHEFLADVTRQSFGRIPLPFHELFYKCIMMGVALRLGRCRFGAGRRCSRRRSSRLDSGDLYRRLRRRIRWSGRASARRAAALQFRGAGSSASRGAGGGAG